MAKDEKAQPADALGGEDPGDQVTPDAGDNLALDESDQEYFDEPQADLAGDGHYVVAKPKDSFYEREPGADPDLGGGEAVDHGYGGVLVVKFEDAEAAQAWSIQAGVMGTRYDREDHALERARYLAESGA